jgi:hypothetical protein
VICGFPVHRQTEGIDSLGIDQPGVPESRGLGQIIETIVVGSERVLSRRIIRNRSIIPGGYITPKNLIDSATI